MRELPRIALKYIAGFVGVLFPVRPAAHVSNQCKSGIRPDKPKINNYTELYIIKGNAALMLADGWRERNVWYRGGLCGVL